MKVTKLNLDSFLKFKMNNTSSKHIIGGLNDPKVKGPATNTPPPTPDGDPIPDPTPVIVTPVELL